MNKLLLFLLSLICLPCVGNQIHVLLDLKTTDNQIRQIMGSYNPETRKVTSFFAEADGAAGLFLAMEAAHLVDTSINDAHGQPVTIKKLDQEIPISTDAATFDLLQDIMAGKKDIANLDQPTTVKLLNTLVYTNAPAVLCDQLVSRCVDFFIAHPEQRCPFGCITAGDDANAPLLYIQNAPLIEAARNNLHDRFKAHVLPHSPWQIAQTFKHPDAARSAAFSPDGHRILTACVDNNTYLWDTNGTLLQTLQHPARVKSATFSPDGHQILTRCVRGHNAYLWDTNGTLLQRLHHPTHTWSATFSPDGHQILIACENHNVYLWDTNGTLLQTLHHPAHTWSVTFSPDGHQILIACENHNVYLWNTNGTLLQTFHHPARTRSATFSPDGHQILTTGFYDSNAYLWDTNGTLLQTLHHPARVESATFSPDGHQILTTGFYDSNAYLWGTNGTILQTLQHPDTIRSATFSPDGHQILTTGYYDSNAYLWDTNGTLLQTLHHPTANGSATFSPDGRQIITACENHKTCIWQLAWMPRFNSILDLSETELRRLALITRVALNPRLTAQEIINLRPIYRNLPRDQRVWVNRRTNHAFPGLFLRTLGSVYATMKGIFKK